MNEQHMTILIAIFFAFFLLLTLYWIYQRIVYQWKKLLRDQAAAQLGAAAPQFTKKSEGRRNRSRSRSPSHEERRRDGRRSPSPTYSPRQRRHRRD